MLVCSVFTSHIFLLVSCKTVHQNSQQFLHWKYCQHTSFRGTFLFHDTCFHMISLKKEMGGGKRQPPASAMSFSHHTVSFSGHHLSIRHTEQMLGPMDPVHDFCFFLLEIYIPTCCRRMPWRCTLVSFTLLITWVSPELYKQTNKQSPGWVLRNCEFAEIVNLRTLWICGNCDSVKYDTSLGWAKQVWEGSIMKESQRCKKRLAWLAR